MKRIATIGLLSLGLALAACGSSSGESGTDGKLVVGTIPNPSVVSIYLAESEGMFADAGVEVEPKVATGFAPNLAAVVNGESQVGFAAVIPLLVAKQKGAPIRIIAGTDAAPQTYDQHTDPNNVYVAPDSGISGPENLEGKTVAVNALGSIQDLGVKIMVAEAGADPDAVEFLTLPYNDMAAALNAGRVDAIALAEPFGTAAKNDGLTPLFSYVTSPTPGAPVGAFFTSENTLDQRADQLGSFVDAITEATEFAAANPAAVREAIPTYTQIPAEVAAQVNTFDYANEITAEQVDALSALLVEYGYMPEPVAAEDVLK